MCTQQSYGKKKCVILSLSLLFIFGVTSVIISYKFLDVVLKHLLVLKNGTLVYQYWQKSQFPLYASAYIFNWTNPEDFYNMSIKPKFEELPPVVIRYELERFNVLFNEEESTISYNQRAFIFLMENMSKIDVRKNVTFLQHMPLTLCYNMRYWSKWKKSLFMLVYKRFYNSLFKTTTIQNLLLDGYEDNFVELTSYFPTELINKRIPKLNRVGYLYGRNGSSNYFGRVSINSSYDNFGAMVAWENSTDWPIYSGECKKVAGYEGDFFPPGTAAKKSHISLLLGDICRTLPLDYERETYVHSIHAYKYVMHSILDNGTLYPEKRCFMSGEPLPFGAYNASESQFGVPMFLSSPHFYNADPFYTDAIEGMKPNQTNHEMYMMIEPNSNILIKMCMRLQQNVYIEPVAATPLEKARRMFIPMFWIETCFELPDAIYYFILILLNLPSVLRILGYSCIVLVVLIYPISTGISIYIKNDEKRAISIKDIHEIEPLRLNK